MTGPGDRDRLPRGFNAAWTPPGDAAAGTPEAGAGPRNRLGTAALVCGLGSLLVFWIPLLYLVLGLPLGVAAVALGIKGRSRAAVGEASNPGVARAGLICGSVGLALCLANIGYALYVYENVH